MMTMKTIMTTNLGLVGSAKRVFTIGMTLAALMIVTPIIDNNNAAKNSMMVMAASSSTTPKESDDNNNVEYVLLGVSGGLQEGFPEHFRMDYHYGLDDEVPAVFVGRALVRGYKSYLDVMQDGWRQYVPPTGANDSQDNGGEGEEGEIPLINCNVIPTGCYHHANEYWIYLVDTRQFQTILFNEPRFLTVAPDLGLVDLTAEETGPVVKHLAYHEISKQNKTDKNYVAFPIVTGAWFNPLSHVPSPVLYTKEDGTEVTNFPQSLATWVCVIDENLSKDKLLDMHIKSSESFTFLQSGTSSEHFFDSIGKRIEQGEKERFDQATKSVEYSPSYYSSQCTEKARFGVSADMARVNYPFSPNDIKTMLQKGGYDIDFKASSVATQKNPTDDQEL